VKLSKNDERWSGAYRDEVSMKLMKNFGSRYAWSRHHRGSWYARY